MQGLPLTKFEAVAAIGHAVEKLEVLGLSRLQACRAVAREQNLSTIVVIWACETAETEKAEV